MGDPIEALKALLDNKSYEDSIKNLTDSDSFKRTPAPTDDRSPASTQQEILTKVSQQEPLLGAIAMVETGGAKDLNHKLDPKSNTTAGGMFGIMPHTAYDIMRLNPDLKKKYPDLAKAAQDDNAQMFTDTFNQKPEVAADFALAHFNRNKSKLNNDEEVAYSWYNGLPGTLKARSRADAIKNSPYVQKVMSNYVKPVAEQYEPLPDDINRAPATEPTGLEALNRIMKVSDNE